MMYSTAAAAAVLAFIAGVQATMAPTYPQPGTVWTAGKQYTITWEDDGTSPKLSEGWKDFKIDFMTGDNMNQIKLETVASGLDATNITSYTWTAPQVDPYSAIYFFMFSNTAGDSAWTTRFAIVANDGDTPAAEPNKTQPTGEAIPWGVGKLVQGSSTSVSNSNAPATTAASTAAPASSSAAVASQSSAPSASGAASSAAVSSGSSAASNSASSSPATTSSQDDTTSGVSALSVPRIATAAAAILTAAYAFA